MPEADDSVKAEWPEGAPTIDDPVEAFEVAQDFVAFVLNIFGAINHGSISPGNFAPDLILRGAWGEVAIPAGYTEESLTGRAWNLFHASLAISAQAADRALVDALGQRPLERKGAPHIQDLPEFDAAWTFVYMIRNAFAHDPFNPRWECKAAYRGLLRLPLLNLEFDALLRHGQRLRSEELGGPAGYLSLLRFLQEGLKALSSWG